MAVHLGVEDTILRGEKTKQKKCKMAIFVERRIKRIHGCRGCNHI